MRYGRWSVVRIEVIVSEENVRVLGEAAEFRRWIGS